MAPVPPVTPPCEGPATIEYVSEAESTSVQASVIAFGVSSSVVAVPSVQTGASLTALIVRSKVAILLSAAEPSVALKVKLSEPL